MTEYEIELRELAEFVLKVAGFEEYLCSKFEEGIEFKQDSRESFEIG